MSDRKVKALKDNGEMTGLESARLLRQYALWKPFRFGWIADEPGWGTLMSLWLRHRLGYWSSYMALRYEKPWTRLRSFTARIRNRQSR